MAQNNSISMPGAFGGLMRYNEEYKSKIQITPAQVIIFIILIMLFVLGLRIFIPLA